MQVMCAHPLTQHHGADEADQQVLLDQRGARGPSPHVYREMLKSHDAVGPACWTDDAAGRSMVAKVYSSSDGPRGTGLARRLYLVNGRAVNVSTRSWEVIGESEIPHCSTRRLRLLPDTNV